MRRKLIPCLLAGALLLGQRAYAKEVRITVDGAELSAPAFAENGTTYAPLSPLLQALGGWETRWDGVSRTASAETDLFPLSVPVGRSQVLLDGYAYDLAVPAQIRDDRTYVPLRVIANLLGSHVQFTGWDQPVAVTTGQAKSYTEEDLYWLSRIISAESRGESLLGQVAVGNVVLNRVASRQFPDTIRDVVFDKKDAVQFEPVENGTIYDTPTAQSVLAARLALNGADAVGDCLYFFSPALSQGTWIRQNTTYHTTIGCHEFYR